MQIVSNVSIVDISNFPFNLPSDQTQTQKKNLQISFLVALKRETVVQDRIFFQLNNRSFVQMLQNAA